MRIRSLEDNMIFQTDPHKKEKVVVFLDINGVVHPLDLQDITDLAYLIYSWVKVSLEGEEWD